MNNIQPIIDRAVRIATMNAVNRTPVSEMVWIPPMSGGDDPIGTFAIKLAEQLSATDTAPWDE